MLAWWCRYLATLELVMGVGVGVGVGRLSPMTDGSVGAFFNFFSNSLVGVGVVFFFFSLDFF